MTNYTLHCVHQGTEHYLQTAPDLAGVKVTRGKVIGWLAIMGVELNNAHTSLLVIRENGKAILQAAYGPNHHAWRKFEPPAELPKPQVHTPWQPGSYDQAASRSSRAKLPSPNKPVRLAPSFASLEARALALSESPFTIEGTNTGRISSKSCS